MDENREYVESPSFHLNSNISVNTPFEGVIDLWLYCSFELYNLLTIAYQIQLIFYCVWNLDVSAIFDELILLYIYLRDFPAGLDRGKGTPHALNTSLQDGL